MAINMRTYKFIGLNIFRALSLVALILVFASSIFTMVKDVEAYNDFVSGKQAGNLTSQALECDYIPNSTVPNQAGGIFWAVLSRVLVICLLIILAISELDILGSFFERFVPIIGPSYGLGAMGIIECLIAANVLSHHVDDFALVSAMFLFSLGCVNILLGLLFREKAKNYRSISSWKEDKKSVFQDIPQATGPSSLPSFMKTNYTGTTSADEKVAEFGTWNEKYAGYGFGRQGEKAAGLKGFILTKPVESLPRYAARPPSAGSRHSSHRSSLETEEEEVEHHSRPISRAESQRSESTSYAHQPPMFKSSSTAI